MNGMMYDVAIVDDNGEDYVVSYVTKSDFRTMDIGLKYVKLSSESARIIKEAKENGYPVMVPKGCPTEIIPPMITVIKPNSNLELEKCKAEYRVSNVMNYMLESMSIIDIYAYTAIFSKFMARGVFITDENIDKVKELYTLDPELIQNRDDAYVKIIMSESKEDLEDLQILVDSMDKMKRVYDVYKDIRKTIKKIKSAETEEQVKSIADTFIKNFNFPAS